jgi:hypothetical protein
MEQEISQERNTSYHQKETRELNFDNSTYQKWNTASRQLSLSGPSLLILVFAQGGAPAAG